MTLTAAHSSAAGSRRLCVSPASLSAVPVVQPVPEFGGDDALVVHAGRLARGQPHDRRAHHAGSRNRWPWGGVPGGSMPVTVGPPGRSRLTVTPVPRRSAAMTRDSASLPAREGP